MHSFTVIQSSVYSAQVLSLCSVISFTNYTCLLMDFSCSKSKPASLGRVEVCKQFPLSATHYRWAKSYVGGHDWILFRKRFRNTMIFFSLWKLKSFCQCRFTIPILPILNIPEGKVWLLSLWHISTQLYCLPHF